MTQTNQTTEINQSPDAANHSPGALRIYLAGPDVFLQNAEHIGEQKKALCVRYGFEGLFPLDSELSAEAASGKASELGFAISAANEQLIAQCDVLIANLTPFRGPSADVGTVYELGLARGLGKPIYGYSNTPTPYLDRLRGQFGMFGKTGDIRDRDGYKIEEFDLHDNLMIEGGIRLSGGTFLSIDKNGDLADLEGFEQILSQLRQRTDEASATEQPGQNPIGSQRGTNTGVE